MMKRITVNCGQLGVTSSSPTSTHSCNKRPSRLLNFASSLLPNYYATSRNNTFIASASSSSSIGGSGSHSSFPFILSNQCKMLIQNSLRKQLIIYIYLSM
jgi:hypothetical protein